MSRPQVMSGVITQFSIWEKVMSWRLSCVKIVEQHCNNVSAAQTEARWSLKACAGLVSSWCCLRRRSSLVLEVLRSISARTHGVDHWRKARATSNIRPICAQKRPIRAQKLSGRPAIVWRTAARLLLQKWLLLLIMLLPNSLLVEMFA